MCLLFGIDVGSIYVGGFLYLVVKVLYAHSEGNDPDAKSNDKGTNKYPVSGLMSGLPCDERRRVVIAFERADRFNLRCFVSSYSCLRTWLLFCSHSIPLEKVDVSCIMDDFVRTCKRECCVYGYCFVY